MKNNIKLASLLFVGFVAAACTTPQSLKSEANAFKDVDWTVQTILGSDVLPDSKPSIRFGSDNSISGSGTCNRLVGTYKMNDGEIEIEPLGTTMMLCAPAENMQERAFLDIIYDVETIQTLADGTLVMNTDEGKTITATRNGKVVSGANTASFICGETPAAVKYSNSGENLDLTVDRKTYSLPRVVSASGAKYQKGDVMFWAKSDWAMMEINGTSYSECSKN